MTEQERIELTYAVFEASPSEWKREQSCASDNCRIRWDIESPGNYYPEIMQVYLDLSDMGVDRYNAPAIVAMLDAMEKVDARPNLYSPNPKGDRTRYMCQVRRKAFKYRRPMSQLEYLMAEAQRECRLLGDTRAEAVARAFVKVFGKEKA